MQREVLLTTTYCIERQTIVYFNQLFDPDFFVSLHVFVKGVLQCLPAPSLHTIIRPNTERQVVPNH